VEATQLVETAVLCVDKSIEHVARIFAGEVQMQVLGLVVIVVDADGQHMHPGAGRFLGSGGHLYVPASESYRVDGKVKKRTLLNLTDWPPDLVEGFRALLKGGTALRNTAQRSTDWNKNRNRSSGLDK
jgi:hypothetical protein